MMNKVIIMGNLTKDPELRQTPAGVPVCRFTVAVNRSYKNRDTGERVEETDFIDCDAWRGTGETIARYFTKGRPILIEGQLRNNNYTDSNGVKHYSYRVLVDNFSFCGDRNGQGGGNGGYAQQGGSYQSQGSYQQQGGYAQQGGYQSQGGYGQQGGYNQPPQQAPRPAAPQQENLNIGDIGEFEEILSDGEVPF